MLVPGRASAQSVLISHPPSVAVQRPEPLSEHPEAVVPVQRPEVAVLGSEVALPAAPVQQLRPAEVVGFVLVPVSPPQVPVLAEKRISPSPT